MKKNTKFSIILVATAFVAGIFSSCNEKKTDSVVAESAKTRIGIAKIVQHEALDDVEKGVIDVIKESGIDAEFDLQNANNDINTANQIALKFRDEKVAAAIGIATPIALALANTIQDVPVIFGTVTDPIEANLVKTLEHGEGNVTGMSDAVTTVQHIALFKDIASIKTLGYIYTSSEANSQSGLALVKQGCEKAGIELVTQSITNSSEVKQAAETIIDRVDGIYLTTDNTVFSALSSLVDVFGNAKKPIFSADVTGAKNGGCLVASGFNYYKAGRATGEIVVDILKNGKKPSEIPVRLMTEPSDSDLLLDFDSAKNCGITFSDELISQANMIFENGMLTEKK